MNRQTLQTIVVSACALIAAASLAIAAVVVINARNEPDRICGAIEQAFKAHDDVFYPALTERRAPLPPRSPEDQKRIDDLISDVRQATDTALDSACS